MKRLFVIMIMISASVMAQEPPSGAAQPISPPIDAPTTERVVDENRNPSTETSTAADRPVAYLRADRLDLDTTVVTGNRELPKVLYIVPWKKAELGEMPAQPFNTLLDEILAPVDRDVFKREVKYFHAIDSGASSAPTPPPTSVKK